MHAFATLLAVFALAHSALAGVYTTSPVASTTGTGGQVLTVNWADDGNAPTVGAIGPCSIDIYTGSRTSQFRLQNLAASVDVSKASSVSATVDPKIGPNGALYFIRFTSLSLKDTAQPQYNYQAYSARFTLTGMTGTFNSTVQQAVDNINGTTPSSSSSSSTSIRPTTTGATTNTTSTNGTASAGAAGASGSTKSAGFATLSHAAPALTALLMGTAAWASL